MAQPIKTFLSAPTSEPASIAAPTNGQKVWLITGCSSGFGREISIAARRRGDLVIATARKIETLEDLKELGCATLTLDVTASDETVKQVVAAAHAIYGRIDILVNNAGFCVIGVVEEASAYEVQAMFDTNLFGLLRMTRAVLPYMREQQSGTIANIGSMAGYNAFPMGGIYNATKFAVAGVTQALRMEVASFGIKVTTVEFGSFLTPASEIIRRFDTHLPAYEPLTNAVLGGVAAVTHDDPAKGAQAVVEALTQSGRCEGRELPRRLPVGGNIYDAWHAVQATAQKEFSEWEDFVKPEMYAFDK
ncbi:hypothetical protein Poli38472_007540 [Pythium oligandrum]|uniref:Uncharacterized protein n=1 Tax=Pythium oligandrum TaxID=41045 RepID=A0A8K1CT84_PYTOL|nr:hypothetical protein Poli38472_007540 [Pythium oligandrum]|eukprot:TMW67868.1 hypothetical protein Poli38472_007540 [Pythium oligandrum]